jgi:hypothetical protein
VDDPYDGGEGVEGDGGGQLGDNVVKEGMSHGWVIIIIRDSIK